MPPENTRKSLIFYVFRGIKWDHWPKNGSRETEKEEKIP